MQIIILDLDVFEQPLNHSFNLRLADYTQNELKVRSKNTNHGNIRYTRVSARGLVMPLIPLHQLGLEYCCL